MGSGPSGEKGIKALKKAATLLKSGIVPLVHRQEVLRKAELPF